MKAILYFFVIIILSELCFAQIPDTTLIAYFPFNGNANDVSGNGHNGTVNGGVLTNDRFNQQEKAYTFPNLHNNIVLDNSTSLNLENGFTLNAWVKYKNINCGIVGKHNCWVVNGFYLGIDNGHFGLRLANSVWSDVVTNEVYVEDQWYMVTGVYDQITSTGKVYVNGVLKASGSVLYNNYSSAPITISEASNGCPDGNMPGAIDEVKIYNRPLSEAEVLNEYNLTRSSLVLYLPFNGNADDESGSGNNGTVSGASLTQDRFGTDGRAYSFDGVDDFITIADNPNLFSDSLTISWWYNISQYDDAGAVIGWIEGGSRYQQFFNGTSFSYFNAYRSDPLSIINPIYTLTNLNEWVNVSVTYKKNNQTSSTTSLFINGEHKQTDIHYMSMEYLPGHNFYIGRNHTPGVEFYGKLDDFRIYNRVLNENEILALYNDSTTYYPQLISEVYPLPNSNNCQYNESIKVYFSEPINEATLTYNSISTHGNLTGSYELIFSYQSSTNILEIQPTVPFKYGEQITVTLDSSIQSVSGINLSPFIFQFNVKPEKGSVKFAVADSFQLNFPPTNIVSGDFNNDNKIDVIVSNYDSSKYTILLNNGSGGFTLGEELAGPFKPYSISFTDIDNDRDLDMIVSTNEENKIRILRGTGQGIFNWILPAIDANAPIATCPGDFDGDGDNDFVALLNYALFEGRAYFYKNDGTGNFTESGFTYTGFPQANRYVVGDVDNDGDLDLVVGQSEYSAIVRTLLNDGSGNFIYSSGSNLGPYPDEIAGGDIDGDYDLDVVHFPWYANGVGIMLNDGNGSYTSYQNLGNVGGQTRNPVVNDFDGDGDLDFVGVFNSNNVGIVKNNTHPDYELSLSYSIPGLKGIASADFDNNGSVDLVGISNTTNQIKFLKNCLDSLVVYFPFNGNANDASGNINNGVINNASFGIDRLGNNSSSSYFYGNWSFIEGMNAGNNLPTGNAPRTFNAWIKLYDNNESPDIFNYGSEQQGPYSMRLMTQNNLGLANGYNYGQIFGITNLIDSTWHFVSGVYCGGSERIIKLFIDGKIDTIGILEFENNTILENRWRIGTKIVYSPTSRFYIDEVKVFDFALSDQQIWDMYNATTTAPTLLFPQDDSTLINPWPTLVLDWDSTVTATSYRLIIANDSLFNTIAYDTILTVSSFNFDDWTSINFDNINWKVRTINDGGVGPWSVTNRFNIILTDVEDEKQLPSEFALLQNYPNPFNPSTLISFEIPKTSNVEIKIYDVIGNEIATLVDQEKSAGRYKIEFAGSILSSGIYFYQLKAGDFIQTKKMILIK